VKNRLWLRTVFLLVLATPLGAVGAQEQDETEAEQYVAAIRSVADVKRRSLSHLNPECGTGSCMDNNAGEVCKLVAALDVRTGGAIATPKQPISGADLTISGGDLQLMKRIWQKCKPTSDGFWRGGALLRVTYQGDEKEVADVSSALRATALQGKNGGTSRAATGHAENRELTACLLREAELGAYSSLDGGRSALSLLKTCQLPVLKWLDSCAAGGETADQCAQKTLILGQAALKMLGKVCTTPAPVARCETVKA
jgi:hypothetical protein